MWLLWSYACIHGVLAALPQPQAAACLDARFKSLDMHLASNPQLILAWPVGCCCDPATASVHMLISHLHAVDGAALAGLPTRQKAVVHTPHHIPSPCPSLPSSPCPAPSPAPASPAAPTTSGRPVLPLPLPALPLRPARGVCPRAAAARRAQQRPGKGGQKCRMARSARGRSK